MIAPGSVVGVVGLGVTGVAVAEAMLDRGFRVAATDGGTGDEVAARAAILRKRGAQVFLGPGADLGVVDLVVPSPGVPEHAPVLAAASGAGIPVWSEPELAWRLADGRTVVLAVTGTNGKTTTTELLAACLGVPTAGNIGLPLISLLAAPQTPPVVAAELSSFQLRFTEALRPHVAVLLNLAADHLDWHGTAEAYGAAKARIWANQSGDDAAVVNDDDPGATALADAHPPPGRRVGFTAGPPRPGQVGVRDGSIVSHLGDRPVVVAPVKRVGVRGPHNVANACAAVAAAVLAGAAPESLAEPLAAFRAGAHRLERVAEVAGVTYVDDSKATNPHAAAAALSTFAGARASVVWIAGGLGKGLDFEALAPDVGATVRAAVTIGSSGPVIAELVRSLGLPVTEAGTLAEAVPVAAALARPGDTVLLAPACASMDQFRDYAERGRAFARAVGDLEATVGGR